MKAVAGRNVHHYSEFCLQQLFDFDQIQKVEFAVRIIFNEDIQIASGLGIVADCRAVQVERRCASRLDSVGVSSEAANRRRRGS